MTGNSISSQSSQLQQQVHLTTVSGGIVGGQQQQHTLPPSPMSSVDSSGQQQQHPLGPTTKMIQNASPQSSVADTSLVDESLHLQINDSLAQAVSGRDPSKPATIQDTVSIMGTLANLILKGISNEIAPMVDKVNQVVQRVDVLEQSVSSMDTRIKANEDNMKVLVKAHNNRSRMRMLNKGLLHGLNEDARETVDLLRSKVMDVLTSLSTITVSDIGSIYRIGADRPKGLCRPIAVCFSDHRLKDHLVDKSEKRYSQTRMKGPYLSHFSPDLLKCSVDDDGILRVTQRAPKRKASPGEEDSRRIRGRVNEENDQGMDYQPGDSNNNNDGLSRTRSGGRYNNNGRNRNNMGQQRDGYNSNNRGRRGGHSPQQQHSGSS